MSDPFLASMTPLAHFYLVSGDYPISIRDQVLRGMVLGSRLRYYDPVLKNGGRLLVVGAGVGGATTAVMAAETGISTTLVEKEMLPFVVQQFAETRFIHPTQYDWPIDHCHRARFPWDRDAPFPFLARTGQQLAALWTDKLNKYVANLEHLTYELNTEVINVHPISGEEPNRFMVRIKRGEAPISLEEYGAIAWAAGVGPENTRVPTYDAKPPYYEGPLFWRTDSLGPSTIGSSKHILISGGGDGGLQDYLRIVTGEDCALEILKNCNIPAEYLRDLQGIEARGQRGLPWDRAYNSEMHYSLLNMAKRCLEDAEVQKGVLGFIERSSIPLYRHASHEALKLVTKDSMLTAVYSLNRFLVLLFAQFIKDRVGAETLHYNQRVIKIEPENHECMLENEGVGWKANGDYKDGLLVEPSCHGKNHKVFLEKLDPATKTKIADLTYDADVIVIRHGLAWGGDLHLPSGLRIDLNRRRSYSLPFHLPGAGIG